MKTIFTVSDIHGHYDEFMEGLNQSGYDYDNDKHLLVVCGDIFDRGSQNLEIFRFLYKANIERKAVVIRGNHDSMLIDYLEYSITPFNFINNGVNKTIDSLLKEENSFEKWCTFRNVEMNDYNFATYITEARQIINKKYPHLLLWLKSLPWYFETENHIFTHAAIDVDTYDWRHPHCAHYSKINWDALSWDDGSFFGKTTNTHKTVIIGHFATFHLRLMYNIDDRTNNKYDILHREDGKIIAIDGATFLSKQVNVLKIKDNVNFREE